MTSPQDALGDTGVSFARERIFYAFENYWTDDASDDIEPDEAVDAFEAAVRAQIDEDVRALVQALRRYMTYNETFGEERLREEFGPPAHEGSSGSMEAWLDRVLREPARAALEPFKAVSPTADTDKETEL